MIVTFFDTESTDLSASWGRLLCCSYVDLGSDEVETHRIDKKPWKGGDLIDDSKLAVAIRDRLEQADMIAGWNSIRHDVPLLNARLALAGERLLRVPRHLDLMYYVSGRNGGHGMKIGSRRLDSAAKFFSLENQKTETDGRTWQLAATGDKKAMSTVVDHCELDVLVTRDLFPHLAPQVKKFKFDLSDVWPFLEEIAT